MVNRRVYTRSMLRRVTISALLGLLLWSVPVPAPADPIVRVVLEDANFPTNLAFAPDGRLFFNEKDTGRIRIIEGGKLLPEPFATLPVTPGGETGLLGIALDPRFASDQWVYVYYSDSTDGRNRLIRIRADGDRAAEQETLFDGLPTVNGYHNGGDLAFGADGKLYLVAGEGHESDRAQDPNNFGGKVLRLNPDGSIPQDNPFGPNSPVFALGIRNSFGLCVDPTTGDLWETENGPDRDDEVNLIRAGENYGWPVQLGPGGSSKGFVDPVLVFPHVIVPTGCAFFGGDVDPSLPPMTDQPGANLYFGDFSGNLHRATLSAPDYRSADGVEVVASFGSGITDVRLGPDGFLYVTTQTSILRVGRPSSAGGPGSPSETETTGRPPATPNGGAGGTSPAIWIGIGVAVAVALAGALTARGRRRVSR